MRSVTTSLDKFMLFTRRDRCGGWVFSLVLRRSNADEYCGFFGSVTAGGNRKWPRWFDSWFFTGEEKKKIQKHSIEFDFWKTIISFLTQR